MIIAVGGQCRNVGKTAAIVSLISALPEARWIAVKATHHATAKSDESTDTSRYEAAGASRSMLIHELRQAAAAIAAFSSRDNIIVESTSIVEVLPVDLFFLLLNTDLEDFKESARRNIWRADALLVSGQQEYKGAADRPQYRVLPPTYMCDEVIEAVRSKLTASLRP